MTHDVVQLREKITNLKSLIEYRKEHERQTYFSSGRDLYDRQQLKEMQEQLEAFNRKYLLNG